jgi:RNA polymerase sigma factor for flagellar operon FliA
LAAPVIGFDTESKPTFRKGEVSTGPHLVQLATDAHVFLFPVACAVIIRCSGRFWGAAGDQGRFRPGQRPECPASRLDIELNNVLDLGELLRGPGIGERSAPRWRLPITLARS